MFYGEYLYFRKHILTQTGIKGHDLYNNLKKGWYHLRQSAPTGTQYTGPGGSHSFWVLTICRCWPLYFKNPQQTGSQQKIQTLWCITVDSSPTFSLLHLPLLRAACWHPAKGQGTKKEMSQPEFFLSLHTGWPPCPWAGRRGTFLGNFTFGWIYSIFMVSLKW